MGAALKMEHADDPRKELLAAVGDISQIEVFGNQLLVAIYIRPEKTKGGIILANQTRDEDKWQGKVGLVLKMGPRAFVDPTEKWFSGTENVKVGDWIYFRPSDAWQLTVNSALCRVMDDISVRGKISQPDSVW